jgi:hypothetical protein
MKVIMMFKELETTWKNSHLVFINNYGYFVFYLLLLFTKDSEDILVFFLLLVKKHLEFWCKILKGGTTKIT